MEFDRAEGSSSPARDDNGRCAALPNAILRITPPLEPSVVRCHLSTLMGRDKLRIADVARLTGLNRSTVSALYRETATRVDLPAIEQLCRLFRCPVGELFEVVEVVPDLERTRA